MVLVIGAPVLVSAAYHVAAVVDVAGAVTGASVVVLVAVTWLVDDISIVVARIVVDLASGVVVVVTVESVEEEPVELRDVATVRGPAVVVAAVAVEVVGGAVVGSVGGGR